MRVTKTELLARAQRAGLYVTEWRPGDGVIRYRFHLGPSDYHSGNHVGKALGIREASLWLDGWIAGAEYTGTNLP